MQDDFRATSKLTLNLGLRWDVYPPWVEIDDRQSNFDVTTGKFVVASDDATIGGVEGRALSADLLEEGPRAALRLRLRPRRQTARRSSAAASASSGTSRRAAPRRRRRRTRRSCSPPSLTPTPDAPTAPTCCSATACRRRRASIRTGRPPARPARSSTSTSATPTRGSGTSTSSAASARNYMVEVAYVGSQGRQMVIKVDINQAPPVVGVTDANVNRPFITLAPARAQRSSQSQSIGKLDYNGLLVKFQRRFANNFSFLNSYTFGKSMDFASDNEAGITNIYDPEYNRGPSDYDVTHTFSSSWIYELPWAREPVLRRLADERDPVSARRPAADRHAGAGRASRPAPATGRTRSATASCRNPTIDRWFDTSCFVPPTEPTGTFGDAGRGIIRGPGSFNIDASLIKNTKIGRIRHRVPGRGVQPAEPPAVRQPEHAPSATPPSAPSRRCSRARPARSAARPSGRCSWA